MDFEESIKKNLFTITNSSFDEVTMQVFNYQYEKNDIYKRYCDSMNKNAKNVQKISDIPFLPIDFFKKHIIKTGLWKEEKIFVSSGTTSQNRSHHFIRSVDFYLENTKEIFKRKFGTISDYQIFALLPSYNEQSNSSLICMVDDFMNESKYECYYIEESNVETVLQSNDKKLIIGVSYALWDLAEKNIKIKNALVFETGGMKGKKRELIRNELHQILKNGLNQKEIWSEYGMTELLSQAYGKAGDFRFPSWAKVTIRDINDPLSYVKDGKTGGINVIDLANIDTCSFVETKDLGRVNNDSFEVLGRFDNSDIRGCNLMI